MYSLSPVSKCKLCPEQATCSDGFRIELQTGYWRSSVFSDDLYECLAEEMCQGGFESQCKDGHRGPICAQCSETFFKSTQLQCLSCGGLITSVTKSVLSLIVSASGVIIAAVSDSGTAQALVSVGLDYLSMLRILSNMNVLWPHPVAYLFTVLGDIGSVGLTSFSDLCIGGVSGLKPIYAQLMISVTYFMSVGAAISLLGLLFACVKCVSKLRYLRILLTISYAMTPLLFMRAIELFSCVEVEGVEKLVFDPSEQCWTARHKKFTLGAALPILIISVVSASVLLVRAILKTDRCFAAVSRWKRLYWSVFLFRSYALSVTLVLSNALVLETQVAVTVLATLMTELVFKLEHSHEVKLISTCYHFAISSTALLSLVLVVYHAGSRDEFNRYATVLIIVSYGLIASPVVYTVVLTARIRKTIVPVAYIVRGDDSIQSNNPLAFVPPPSIAEDSLSLKD